MSTASLPSYHYEPQEAEQRLAFRLRLSRIRPSGDFVKNSKSGGIVLRLAGQLDGIAAPEYGRGAEVEGTVELTRTESILSVDVKIEGSLKLKEIAEGGTSTSSLCLDTKVLWSKEENGEPCPTTLPFSLTLPSTFSDGKATYALPPTYEAHLSGVPGFRANIDYSVSAIVHRNTKKTLFGNQSSTVSTRFTYLPRSRPAQPIPAPLFPSADHAAGFIPTDWAVHESTIRSKLPNTQDILARLFIPSCRVFCLSERIPFHVYFLSSAVSLAAFMPLAPSAMSKDPPTKVTLLRQSIVDVRSISRKRPLTQAHKTDIWKTVQIGQGSFRHDGDGPDWMAWSGEIIIDSSVKVGGFKASGLTVKDFIVVAMTPPDPSKTPFSELRCVAPVRLTTDPWSSDGIVDFPGLEYSEASTPSEPECASPQ